MVTRRWRRWRQAGNYLAVLKIRFNMSCVARQAVQKLAIVFTRAAPPSMLVSTRARRALVAGLCRVLEKIAMNVLLPVVVLLRNVPDAPLSSEWLDVSL